VHSDSRTCDKQPAQILTPVMDNQHIAFGVFVATKMTKSRQNGNNFNCKGKWLKTKERLCGKYFYWNVEWYIAFQMEIVRNGEAWKFACRPFKHVGTTLQCEKRNTKFHLQYNNDQI